MKTPQQISERHCRTLGPSRTALAFALLVPGLLSACTVEPTPRGIAEYLHDDLNSPKKYRNMPIRPADRFLELHNEGIPAGEEGEAILPTMIDLHADTLMLPDEDDDNGRDDDFDGRDYDDDYFDGVIAPHEHLLVNNDEDGHVDLKRLAEGNMLLQVFSAASRTTADILAADLPGFSDPCPWDEDCQRRNFERDPHVITLKKTRDGIDYNYSQHGVYGRRYDDPGAPYQLNYGKSDILPIPRDIYTYAYRTTYGGWDDNAPYWTWEKNCRAWYSQEAERGTWPWGGNEHGSGRGNWPPATCPEYEAREEYLERLLITAERLREAAAYSATDADTSHRLRMVRSKQEFDALLEARSTQSWPNRDVGGLLSTEGLYLPAPDSDRDGVLDLNAEEEMQARFNALYNAGYRMIALTHFLDNDYGGSSTGMGNAPTSYNPFAPEPMPAWFPPFGGQTPDGYSNGRGLFEAGRFMIEQAISHGVVVDVAHASGALQADVIDIAAAHETPIVHSHGGLGDFLPTYPFKKSVRSCPNANPEEGKARNLSDDQVVAIARTGGVVGIGPTDDFVCGVEAHVWAEAIRYAVDLVNDAHVCLYSEKTCTPDKWIRGEDHIAMGSDFDGGVEMLKDVAEMVFYTRALTCEKSWSSPSCLDTPFSDEDALRIMGGNSFRVIYEILPDTVEQLP